MNLNNLVIAKIKQLGPTKAASYFSVSVPTIYSWQKKNNAPVSAAQKVIDEDYGIAVSEGAKEAANQGPWPGTEVATAEEQAPEIANKDANTPRMLGSTEPLNLESLDYRVSKMERVIAAQYDLKRVQTESRISPFSSGPNSGMEVISASKVIGEEDKPPDAPANWNAPKQQGAMGTSWNKPLKQVGKEGSRAHNWNAPIVRTPVEQQR